MSKLYIIRGLPGSGKSTLARRLSQQLKAEHWEADMYFTDKDGHYQFDGQRIEEAHDFCTRHVQDAMYHHVDVIVSNTFTRVWELHDYLATAESLGVEVFIIECTAAYGSIHGIPDKVYLKMKQRWMTNAQIEESMVDFSSLTKKPLTINYQSAGNDNANTANAA